MNTDNVWIVVVLLLVIIIGANLFMFGIARGFRNIKGSDLNYFSNATKPWKKEDEGLQELSELVKTLKKPPQDQDEN